MNMPNKASFGPVSQDVHATVMGTLQNLPDRSRERRRAPAVLIFAAAIVLMGATALAIANRAGLNEFFAMWNDRSGYVVPEGSTSRIGGDAPLLEATMGDLDIVVAEAMGDGENFYFATTVALVEGKQGHLVNLDSLKEGFLSAPTFDDGLPAYWVTTEIVSGEYGAVSFDWIDNEDGSISYFSDPQLAPAGDVTMGCMVTYARTDDGLPPLQNEFIQETLRFDLPKAGE